MIELYDVGNTIHRSINGMYEFIIANSQRYVNSKLSEELEYYASDKLGTIPQPYFTEMCNIWVKAFHDGDFFIGTDMIYEDVLRRFKKVKVEGKKIGIFTSATREFTNLLVGNLEMYVDKYFFGPEIGDKNHSSTFKRIYEKEGDISAVFDDKLSVCKAAKDGLGESTSIFLVDRNMNYKQKNIRGISVINSFDEI